MTNTKNMNLNPSNDDFFIKREYDHIETYLKQVEKNLYKYGSKNQYIFQQEKHNSLKQLSSNDLIDLWTIP